MYESAPAEEVQKRITTDDLEGFVRSAIESSGQKCEETVIVDTRRGDCGRPGYDCGIHRMGSGHSGAGARPALLLGHAFAGAVERAFGCLFLAVDAAFGFVLLPPSASFLLPP